VNPIYFRITEAADPDVFDGGWVEIPATQNRFVLDRWLWRANDVSRSAADCAALRFDLQDEVWEMRNRAPGRIVILHNGRDRYELVRGMSAVIGPGEWTGTLTDAFTFRLSHTRPAGPIRRHGEPEPVPDAPDDPTEPRSLVLRAERYLDKHRLKRLALVYMWRQQFEHTPDLAEDLTSAEVGKAFGEPAPTITGWREDLAFGVYLERGHQNLIRDLVVKHRLMTRDDLREADRYVAERRRRAEALHRE
jgi:hypothetical protein